MKDVSFLTTSNLEPSSKIFLNNPCSALLMVENNFTGLFRVEICVSVEKKDSFSYISSPRGLGHPVCNNVGNYIFCNTIKKIKFWQNNFSLIITAIHLLNVCIIIICLNQSV